MHLKQAFNKLHMTFNRYIWAFDNMQCILCTVCTKIFSAYAFNKMHMTFNIYIQACDNMQCILCIVCTKIFSEYALEICI